MSETPDSTSVRDSLFHHVPRWVRCLLCDTRWLNDTGVCETCGGTKWENDE